MKRVGAWFAASFVIALSMAQAQENVGEQKDESKNAISIFSGALTDLTADVTGPSVGVGYVRDITGTLHFVAQSEWASASERELAFGAGIELRPPGGFKLAFVPGVVVEGAGDDDVSIEGMDDDSDRLSRDVLFVFRVGVGWGFEVSGVELIPEFNVDLLQSEEGVDVHLVYGVSIELPF